MGGKDRSHRCRIRLSGEIRVCFRRLVIDVRSLRGSTLHLLAAVSKKNMSLARSGKKSNSRLCREIRIRFRRLVIDVRGFGGPVLHC